MSMLRKRTTHQFDLFCDQPVTNTNQAPPWQALPEETRQRLTKLMVRLILDHVDDERGVQQEGANHDA
jgi:hypothetical protein